MKVFVVSFARSRDEGGDEVYGYYSTKEKADVAFEEQKASRGEYYGQFVNLDEFEMDIPVSCQ